MADTWMRTVPAVAVLVAATLGAQTHPDHPFRAVADSASPRIAALRADVAAGQRRAADEFWADVRQRGTPLVEPSPDSPRHSLVTFVWRGTNKTRNAVIVDGVAAGVGGVNPANSQMQRLAKTDVWFRTYEVRNDARFTYKLSENDSMESFISPTRRAVTVRDPFNARISVGFSYLELPQAPPLLPDADAPPATGNLEHTTFASTAGNEYGAVVYTPPGFRRDGPVYPLIIVFDGRPFTTLVPSPAILDSLIARGRIRPIVAALLDTSFARDSLLKCSRAFADELAAVVVPRIRTAYHAGTTARDTAVAGSSLGGLAAACTAIAHPEVFGSVLSQSGSYWWTPDTQPEWLTRQVRQAPALPLRFFLEVGAMEIPEQLDTNRRFRDALRSNGATVEYREFNGNHHYLPWHSGFADGLVSLFGHTPP